MRHILPHSHIRKIGLVGISIIFSLILIHLIGVYIYKGGNYIGLPGGSTSIAIVGDAPDMMNPLSYGKNPSDFMLYPFIYRGLIRYNTIDDTAREDIAQCDLSKIEKITCTIRPDMLWSDGTMIKDSDVLATFRAFAELGENPDMSGLLRDTRIESKGGVITFHNPDKDVKIFSLLSYPIYRSDMVEQMRTDRFTTGSHITSGQYMFSEQGDDTAYSNNRITLTRNQNISGTKAWFDKIHFKFFKDIATIKTAEDTLGIIIPPPREEILSLSERFRPYSYTTYEYFSVFFQTDRLSKSLRNALHWQIGTSMAGKIQTNHQTVNNIFPGKDQILPRGSIGSFADIMKKNGFMKRDDWIASIETTPTTITGSIVYDKPSFFVNKQNSNVLFIDDVTGGLLLSGNVPSTVASVIINGYQLKEFRPGNKKFSYRVSLEDATIVEGKNTYLLEGKIGENNTTTGEILTIYYSADKTKLAEYKKNIDDEYFARNNTPALIAEREREKLKQKETALTLDPLYYYNKEGEVFKIKVAYVTGPQSTEGYARMVEDTLKNLSIMSELIALEPKALQEIIKNGKKEYDILIAGISAGDTLSDISQLFDPNQAKKGINFANIEIPKIINYFNILRATMLPEQKDVIINDIITIMEEESFFLPISSPIRTLYIDRNLKGIRNISVLAGTKNIYDIVEFASIKDTYVFNTAGKSPIGFFNWLGTLLFF